MKQKEVIDKRTGDIYRRVDRKTARRAWNVGAYVYLCPRRGNPVYGRVTIRNPDRVEFDPIANRCERLFTSSDKPIYYYLRVPAADSDEPLF